MAVNSLGGISFLIISRDGKPAGPVGLQQRVQVEERAGVDGSGLKLLGNYGSQTELMFERDVLNLVAGEALVEQLRTFAKSKLTLIHNGFDWDSINTRFYLLHVETVELFTVETMAGQLITPASTAWIGLKMRLLSVQS